VRADFNSDMSGVTQIENADAHQGLLNFRNSTNAASVVIDNLANFNNGFVSFFVSSSAANATINNAAGPISAVHGIVTFHDSSSAGNAIINNGKAPATAFSADLYFLDSSSASALAPLSPCQSWLACVTNTIGYDFR
jgi:hypothetical protein